ncbi:MAG: hypothetical protein IJX46_02815 [Clostridia bacterium]|nr:hypothetical protein [Clostridia bacterium]
MAITNFIPTVWSEVLYEELSHKYVGVANCNRDFDVDIKEMGSEVKICGVLPVTVFDYKKDTDLNPAEGLYDQSVTIKVDKAKAFNFVVDDIDTAQAHPGLMRAAMRSAAEALANEADSFVYSLYNDIDDHRIITDSAATYETILDDIIKARELIIEGGGGNSDIVLEVSPAVASLILKAKIMYGTSDNTKALNNGYLGSVCGCDVYVSPNIEYEYDTEGNRTHACIMRTKRAVAFVEQLTKIDAYRPENRFADAVKGLHLYGGLLIYPEEMTVLKIKTA